MELKDMVRGEENVLYEGKPKKSCFVLESVFNPFGAFALLWGGIDLIWLAFTFSQGAEILLPFVAIHATPVWVYLVNVLLCHKRWKNRAYIVTNKNIYTSSGTFTRHNDMSAVDGVCDVDFHQGLADKMTNTADIVVTVMHMHGVGGAGGSEEKKIRIEDVSDYMAVYNALRDMMEAHRKEMDAAQQNIVNGLGGMGAAAQMMQNMYNNGK